MFDSVKHHEIGAEEGAMILVIGATGNVGSEVVRGIVAAGHEVRAFVRGGDGAAEKLPRGVEIARGDLAAPASIAAALEGVDKMYLLAPLVPNMPELEAAAIGAAKNARVKHIVKHSNMGAPEGASTLQRWHRAGEKLIESSGIPWTFVRPTGFMSNAFGWAETIKTQGAVYSPGGTGKLSVVDPRDIAAVAVKALTERGHEGKAYDVTGPQALSTAEQVNTIAEVIGKPLRYIDVPEPAAREGMLKMGMPAPIVEAMIEFMRLVRAGDGAIVSNDVEKVTGRAPRTFAAWARENAAFFR
jgi:(4-alkanoyl-5-oxo-2,5-dihydrofuran-3-yl)methyl phosphate reductase